MPIKAQFPEEQSEEGEFERQEDAFRDFVSTDGSTPYPSRRRTLPSLRLACLPLGEPHADRAKIEGPARRNRPHGR